MNGATARVERWLQTMRVHTGELRHGSLRPKIIGVGVMFVAVATVAMLAPIGQDLKVQLLYLPIVLGAWAFGAIGAIVVGAAATIGGYALQPTVIHGLPIQSFIFLAFTGACAALSTSSKGQAQMGTYRPAFGERSVGQERILESLARTVEVRDHHTQGHCRRVARNAMVLGSRLGLSEEELEVLHWAALLHDLGKIAVPDYILLKNGRLSEEEYEEIRRHPSYGADLLTSVSASFRQIADVVRAHHERWDGHGYPLGYRGTEIPKLARVIAVVDVFEALTSERPYRSPMPTEQALRYVANGAGSQFDPAIVAVFQGLVSEGAIRCTVGRDSTVVGDLMPVSARLRATP